MAPGLAFGRITAGGQELEKDRGKFIPLVPVEGGGGLVDFNGLFNFPGVVVWFGG